MSRLAQALRILRVIVEALRRVDSLFGRRVLTLSDGQRVIKLRDSDGQPSPRDLSLRLGRRLCCSGALVRRTHIILRRKTLVKNAPRTINVNSVVRDESSHRRAAAVPLG